jgi:hypothetical protein
MLEQSLILKDREEILYRKQLNIKVLSIFEHLSP